MFNLSSSTNNSSAIPLGLRANEKDGFNFSTSDFFDSPPPPPGGSGGGFSPLFNQPFLDLVPHQIIDLSFLRRFEVFNSTLNTFGDFFSSKIQTTPVQDFSTSKSPFPLHSKYNFSNLFAFNASTIPKVVLQFYGAASSRGSDNPIHRAAKTSNLKKLRQLLQKMGATAFSKPDNDGYTPAHHAAKEGHVDVLNFLRELEGVNLNQPDTQGRTPAHHAAIQGHVEVLRFFATLEGTTLNLPDNQGQTPAHLAAIHGCACALSFLATLEGVNPNQADNQGQTPAHLAALHGHIGALSFLETLEVVNFNQPNKQGQTPTHLAAIHGHTGILRFLATLERVRFDQPDNEGHVPAYYTIDK